MYLPEMYRIDQIDVVHALVRERPFASLVTSGDEGLVVDHLPLLLDPLPAPNGVLRGHVAKANPLWRTCDVSRDVVAVFNGPQAYVSPSWYPSKKEHGKVVPTWDYAVVHAHGTIRFTEDPVWLRDLLDALTASQEDHRPVPWGPGDAPDDFIDGMLKAIVGLEITVSRLEGKAKTSQNRNEADRRGASRGLALEPGTDAAEIAELVGEGLD